MFLVFPVDFMSYFYWKGCAYLGKCAYFGCAYYDWREYLKNSIFFENLY